MASFFYVFCVVLHSLMDCKSVDFFCFEAYYVLKKVIYWEKTISIKIKYRALGKFTAWKKCNEITDYNFNDKKKVMNFTEVFLGNEKSWGYKTYRSYF